MKVKELIAILQTYDQELEVLTYNGIAEEYDVPSKGIIITSEENEPYSKADYPRDMFNTQFPYLLI